MSQLPRYESYKDSGVQWLGEIPNHWIATKFKYYVYFQEGPGILAVDFRTEGVPLIRIAGLKTNSVTLEGCNYLEQEKVEKIWKHFKLTKGDMLISASASLSEACEVSDETIGAIPYTGLIKVRPISEALDKGFLKIFLSSSPFYEQVSNLQTGATIQHYGPAHLKQISIIVPPVSEQKIIADFLDKRLAQVDALIAKQEILLEKLAEQRVALISHAVTKGLNPDVEMKESRIRWVKDIPIHWNVVPVRYLFEFKNNQRIPVSAEDRGKMSEKIYPYYGASGVIDFVEDYIFDEDLLLVAEDGANLLSRSTPLAFKASGKYWVNNHAHIIKPLDNNLMYWEYVLALYDFTPLISGSAQPKLTKDNLASIKLPNPPDEEKRKICNFLDKPLENLKEQKLKIEKILETLKEYRSTLITQVVTGKIDVRNLKVN